MSKKQTVRRIHFDDQGQDFLTWDIDENGKVLECKPFMGGMWNGSIVDFAFLKEGRRLECDHPRVGRCGIKYRVVKIENLES